MHTFLYDFNSTSTDQKLNSNNKRTKILKYAKGGPHKKTAFTKKHQKINKKKNE